jgi:hypothetical protein
MKKGKLGGVGGFVQSPDIKVIVISKQETGLHHFIARDNSWSDAHFLGHASFLEQKRQGEANSTTSYSHILLTVFFFLSLSLSVSLSMSSALPAWPIYWEKYHL